MQKTRKRTLAIMIASALLAAPVRSEEGDDDSICKSQQRGKLERKYDVIEISGVEQNSGIVAICSKSRKWSTADAIGAIESGTKFYVCDPKVGVDAKIVVVGDSLRTEKDGTIENNLGELPDCGVSSAPAPTGAGQ